MASLAQAPPVSPAPGVSADPAPSAPRRSVPVTIVTGFLGSGKTTLLNYILTAHHGKRIAVIENEFGEEIGVESLIAKDGANGEFFDEFFALGNGCICCSVRDDLVNTLERLLERKDKFDYILIETTGMADPGPIASMFWLDDELESQMHLDAVITIVDAKNIMRRLGDSEEATLQIAYADILMLNKIDLMDDEVKLNGIVSTVSDINGVARIYKTTKSVIDLNNILDVHTFNAEKAKDLVAKAGTGGHHGHKHGLTVSTITLASKAPVNLDKFNQWLAKIIWVEEGGGDEENGSGDGATPTPKIFRMKGIIAVENSDEKFILQAVNDLFECEPFEHATEGKWAPSEDRTSKIVVIGKHLDGIEIYDGFERSA